MTNTFELIDLTILSLKDFQNQELATNVIKKINEYGKDFAPQVYGIYQPLKNKYNPNDISDVVNMWLNQEDNRENAQNSYAAGQLLMEKRRGHKVSYQMRWEKDNQVRFNSFTLSINIEYLKSETGFNSFMSLCHDLINLLEPVHGEIVNLSFPGWEAPKNLRIRHPELNWMVLFGKPYIDLFGREKLMNAPCYNVQSMGENIISLQLTESIFEPIPSNVREELKNYLGKDAFVEEGKSYRSYKGGIVPMFDFSEILFDKARPIEEPQIRTRER